jgi:multiubiquitin
MSDKDNEDDEDRGNGRGHDDDRNDDKGTTTIFVNTREKEVKGKEVTFKQIVRLAFENPPTGENIEITVAYRKGPPQNPSGTMHPGETVRIKKGMVFDVTATDKS